MVSAFLVNMWTTRLRTLKEQGTSARLIQQVKVVCRDGINLHQTRVVNLKLFHSKQFIFYRKYCKISRKFMIASLIYNTLESYVKKDK